MNNFELYNPTKIIFGKNEIAQLKNEIPPEAKVMLLYGSGSIYQNGIYKQVTEALKDFDYIEFGGIPPNPEYSILLEALEAIKLQKVTFLLAVGGGSVIDGTKFLAAAAHYKGNDFWDILSQNIRTETAMPFGTILTLPATGSEMNSGAVISRKETKEKRAMGGKALFPQFSILDPQVVASIPSRQIANGITDAFMHVLEQYLTYPTNAKIPDRFAEGILQSLIEVAPQILANPENYEAAANFMWCCTMALNGLIQKGVPTDWAVHAIGHELTALYKIDHARTLAIIAPSRYRYAFEGKKAKLAQYAERVWGKTNGSLEDKAYFAIDKTEAFFQSLGIKTKLADYVPQYQETAEIIKARFKERKWLALGERQDLTPEAVAQIVEMSYE